MFRLRKVVRICFVISIISIVMFIVGSEEVFAKQNKVSRPVKVINYGKKIDCRNLKKNYKDCKGLWSWNYKKKILTLNNCYVIVKKGNGILVPNNTTIVAKGNCGVNAGKMGIVAEGNLYIEGSLKVVGNDIGIHTKGFLKSKKNTSTVLNISAAKGIELDAKYGDVDIEGNIDIHDSTNCAISSKSDMNLKINGVLNICDCDSGIICEQNNVINIRELYIYVNKKAVCSENKNVWLNVSSFFEINHKIDNAISAKENVCIDGAGFLGNSNNSVEDYNEICAISAGKDVNIKVSEKDYSQISIEDKGTGIKSGNDVEVEACKVSVRSDKKGIDATGKVNIKNCIGNIDDSGYYIEGDEVALVAKKIEFGNKMILSDELQVMQLEDGRETFGEGTDERLIEYAAKAVTIKNGTGIVIHANDGTGRVICITKLNDTCTLSKDLFKRDDYEIIGWTAREDEYVSEKFQIGYEIIYCNEAEIINVYADWGEKKESDISIGDNIKLTLDEKEGILRVAGKGDMIGLSADTSIISLYKEMGITIRKVIIDEGVTSIGRYAFCNGDKIEEVILPKSLKSIGNSSFYNCKSIKEICIPENVTNIEAKAFMSCNSLQKICIPDSIETLNKYIFRISSGSVDTRVYVNNNLFKNFDWLEWNRKVIFDKYENYFLKILS